MLEETSNLKVEKLSKWMRKTTKHFAIDFRSHTGKNQAVLRERVLSTGRATRHGKLRENLISRRRKCQGLSSFTCIVERGNAELGLWRRRSGSFLSFFLSFSARAQEEQQNRLQQESSQQASRTSWTR